ncbi:hypothetical protein RHGRI_001646 [Rhododendron griersonianum]|uniref:DUF4283 domain-containing protein n=1 Tax=Rhododendron griersonianum TaxID=479676 RepID=A0AAV6LM71_9ERIC|nr:hypothetical protein RHGRI_001646 [Rhododendron griersonianum]
MADGTVSMANGLGLKALDSNVVKRRQLSSELSRTHQPQSILSNLETSKTTTVESSNTVTSSDFRTRPPLRSAFPTPSPVGFGAFSPRPPLSDLSDSAQPKTPQSNPNSSIPILPDPQSITRVHSPKHNQLRPVHKSQQVPQKEGVRSASEARMLDIIDHLEDELNISEDPFVLYVVTAKLQSIQQTWKKADKQTPQPSTSPGCGAISPNSNKKSSPSRKIQQALFQEGLILEAEERAREQQYEVCNFGAVVNLAHGSSSQTQRSPAEVQSDPFQQQSDPLQQQQRNQVSSILAPKTLINPRGIPYLEGDPNMGYDEIDTKPRRPWTSIGQSNGNRIPNKPRQVLNGPKPKPKNWAALLQSQSRAVDVKLEFHPDFFRGKEAQVEIDIELTDVGLWNKYLVGHFLDGKMAYPLVLSTAKNQWKELFVAVKPGVAGCYLFKFRDEQAKQSVLDGGPYFISQRYLVLKDWHRMMQPVKEQPSHIPVWVRLHNLPLELWNQECLSRVASTIGRPLHVDQATAKTSRQPGLLQTKSTSARVCIEISAEHDLPEDVRITVENNSVVVPIEYQVLPSSCKECKVFGHSITQCSKTPSSTSNSNQEWTKMGNGKQEPDTNLNATSTNPTVPLAVAAVSEIESDRVLERTTNSSLEPPLSTDKPVEQLVSPRDSPSSPQKQLALNPIELLDESDSEDELLGVLEGVVSSCHEVSQPQLNLEGMGSRSGPILSAVPKGGMVNQALSPKPPDPQGSEIRDKASKEDLKENFQKVISRSTQRKMKKLAREQLLRSQSRGRT